MKFTADCTTLKTAFADVARFTAASSTAGLASAHVTVDGSAATVTGFDGETGARASVKVTGVAAGSALLPRPLLDYVTALPGGSVEIEVVENTAKVTAGSLSAKFRCEDQANYPTVSFLSGTPAVLTAADLRHGLRQAKIAAAGPASNRAALCGVLFEVDGGAMRLVATDSYRLAVATIASTPLPDGTRCTIPIRAITELERLLGRVEEVEVRLSESAAAFTVGDVQLTTRLIGQAFPNYAAIIPADTKTGFTVAAAAVAESVKRLKIVAPRETRSLKVTAADGVVTLSTTSPSGDIVVEPIEATVTGTPAEFAVNVDYFAEAVATLGADEVDVAVTSALKPLLITGKNIAVKHVVMPVRA